MNHQKNYKNLGKSPDELRRGRKDFSIELRKAQREEIFHKSRNCPFPVRQNIDSGSESSSDDDEMILDMPDLKGLAALAADSSNPSKQFDAVQTVRKIVSSDNSPPVDEIINGDILTILLECLKNNAHPMLQIEASWALTNIAAGTSEHTWRIVDAGAVTLLFNLLNSPESKVCEQAMWTLGNICGDGPELRDVLVQQGIVAPLIVFISRGISTSFLRTVAWVTLNMCRYKDFPLPPHTIQELSHCLKMLLRETDMTVLKSALWAITYLADGPDQIQMLLDGGMISNLIALLGHKDHIVQVCAIRAVGNIVCGSDAQTQLVVNYDVLSCFPMLMNHCRSEIRIYSAWCLSNIMAGNQMQIQTVIDEGLLPIIINSLTSDCYRVKWELTWAIANMTYKSSNEQVKKFVQAGALPPFIKILTYKDNDMAMVVLKGLQNIFKVLWEEKQAVSALLEECDGIENIELLQYHENPEIAELASEIAENFFNNDNLDEGRGDCC